MCATAALAVHRPATYFDNLTAIPIPMTPNYIKQWVHDWLWRIGHLWIENPLSLATFSLRLVRSLAYWFADLGSRRAAEVVWIGVRQTFKTLLRGILAVMALGLAFGIGLGIVTSGLGSALRPIFDDTVMAVVIRDASPLGLAVFLSARTGGTIAAKLAMVPLLQDEPTVFFSPQRLQQQVVPNLLAALVTSGVFYVVLASCILGGYASNGVLGRLPHADTLAFARALSAPFAFGAVKAILFGGIVVYVASAFGVQAAERYISREKEARDLHYAVWESTVTSVLVCTLLTVLFWRPL